MSLTEYPFDHRSPWRFAGMRHTATFDLSGNLIADSACEVRMAMSS